MSHDPSSTDAEPVEPETPRRRVVIELKLGADSWEDAADALHDLARQFDMGERRDCTVLQTGGARFGYTCLLNEDPFITHDSYFEAIKGARPHA